MEPQKDETHENTKSTLQEEGGLLVIPKERHVFKVPEPKGSLLGTFHVRVNFISFPP